MSNTIVYKNTFYLYIRMFVMMAISLFSSRIILQTLGASDYGLYNVVGGFIAFFFFISNSLSLATQRFMAYAIGQDNALERKQVFTISLLLYFLLSLLILALGLIIGPHFIEKQLNIPIERIDVAKNVFILSLFSAIFTFIRIPYTSAIIAHEKMSFYSWISILESILKLVSLYFLYIIEFDKLIIYSVLQVILALIITIWHIYYCYKFRDYTLDGIYNIKIIKNLVAYIGWNVFGGFADLMLLQGLNIVLNLFFGTIINAAQAIAVQIKSQIAAFVNNLNIASSPSITKYYAAKKNDECEKLMFTISKLNYLLLLIISIPIIIVLPTFLDLWLGKGTYPNVTIILTNLILINTLIDTLPGAIQSVVFASGKIKSYTIVLSIIKLVSIFFVYVALHYFKLPEVAYYILCVFAIPRVFYQIYYCSHLLGFRMILFYKQVLKPDILVTILSIITSWILYRILDFFIISELLFNISVGFFTFLIVVIYTFYWGCTPKEQNLIMSFIKRKISKL